MKRLIALAICLFAFPIEASAKGFTYFRTGNTLLELCDSKVPIRIAACTGYITGIVDGQQAVGTYLMPDGVTAGQLTEIVVNALKRHPEDLHEPASVLILVALDELWPKPEKKG